jgi:hypothetical protein
MLTKENWFALAPFHELPAEHAALWTSSFHLLGGLKRSHLLALLLIFRLGAHEPSICVWWVCLFQVVSDCRVILQAVGLLPMWMMILSRAPLMILVFDP